MKCPFCGCFEDKVLDSRSVKEGEAVRRRRECVSCKRRYTTFEQIEELRLVVVKRDGRREPFDRTKVMRGLTVACEKRPVATDILEAMVDRIECEIVDSGVAEIDSMRIGELAMQGLKKVDHIAYVRFASVYRQFEDLGQFRKIIDGLGRAKTTRKS